MILLDALPLLLLLGLLGSGRASPLWASGAALAGCLPALLMRHGAGLPALLAQETLLGGYLALAPVLILGGGLAFHAAVAQHGPAEERAPTAARIFAVSFPLGAFLESATGFAVGAVFALSALRGMRVGGAVAVALAAQALVLVPWGGLGPGTALGAALAGVPAQRLGWIAALGTVPWMLLLLPLHWRLQRLAGAAPDGREMLAQTALMLLFGALLLFWNAFAPFELSGVVAAGVVAAIALWRADPPAHPAQALRSALPYLLLAAGLLAARLWHGAPEWRPFPGFPAYPLSHVAVVLGLMALLVLGWRRRMDRLPAALRRAGRPALAMLLYVVLGRWLAGGGMAAELARGLTEALGPAAPFAVAPMAMLAGMVTGSNVGSNAALMPVQVGVAQAVGLDVAVVAGVQGFSGGAGAGMSAAGLAMMCALLADGTRPAQGWRLLLPSILANLLIGTGLLLWLG